MIKYVYGDIVSHAMTKNYDFLIHGCNCFCVMGAGVAKVIADRWPGAKEIDKRTIKGSINKLGTVTLYHDVELNLSIVNAYTQFEFHNHTKRCLFDYDAFQKIIDSFKRIDMLNYHMSHFSGEIHNKKFLMPMIGAGLAGGDWNRIEKILNDSNLDITVVIYRN